MVLSAHLDHIGITPPVKGDSINNGALDNASGVATTLEVARLFRGQSAPAFRAVPDRHRRGKGPDRGGIFRPQSHRAATAIAADVDLDMPILTYDFTDVTAFGADRSSIGPSRSSARPAA